MGNVKMELRYAYIYPNNPTVKYNLYDCNTEWIVIEEKMDGRKRRINAGMPFKKLPTMEDVRQFI